MTKKQLCELLVREGLDYAFITLLITYAVSALAVGVGVRAMVEGGFTTFRFTLLPLIIFPPLSLGCRSCVVDASLGTGLHSSAF